MIQSLLTWCCCLSSSDFSEIVTKVITTTNKSVGKAHKDLMRTHCEKARENDGVQAALGLVW